LLQSLEPAALGILARPLLLGAPSSSLARAPLGLAPPLLALGQPCLRAALALDSRHPRALELHRVLALAFMLRHRRDERLARLRTQETRVKTARAKYVHLRVCCAPAELARAGRSSLAG
jgi:hypothetical protein